MINTCFTRVALTISIINESMFSVFFSKGVDLGKKKVVFTFYTIHLKKKKKKKKIPIPRDGASHQAPNKS